jgi:hypothetical protein
MDEHDTNKIGAGKELIGRTQAAVRISSLFLKRWETRKRGERESRCWGRGWGEGGRFNSSSPHF